MSDFSLENSLFCVGEKDGECRLFSAEKNQCGFKAVDFNALGKYLLAEKKVF